VFSMFLFSNLLDFLPLSLQFSPTQIYVLWGCLRNCYRFSPAPFHLIPL